MATLLQSFDDTVFMLWKDLGKTIGLFDLMHSRRRQFAMAHVIAKQSVGIADIGADTQLAGNLPSNGDIVASHHFYRDPITACLGNSGGGILTGWIEQRQDTEKYPLTVLTSAGYSQSAETLSSELVYELIRLILSFRIDLTELHDHLRRTLGSLEGLTIGALSGRFGALAHRIERRELHLLVRLQFIRI